MTPVDAATAHAMFHDGRPLAPLDLREAGQFGEGHALFAMPLPYSRLEMRITDLVPWRGERVLLIDQGCGLAEWAARILARAGYDNLHVLKGGMPAWAAAGYGVFKGVNVPSKLLGECACEIWHPDRIGPDVLADWQAQGRAHRLFDARPADEYARMRVPGAVCLPNGELPRHAAALSGEVPVVITCAGRTRGIVGAIGLRLAGYQGPVHVLENGTQGWALSGRALERDNDAPELPQPDALSQEAAQVAGDRLAARFGLQRLTGAQAQALLDDAGATTYLVDLRSPAEGRDDPLPGAIRAPGGQLVQATDQWLAVRHARVILCCDTGLRSALAGFWLHQMGYDVGLLSCDAARALDLRPPAPISVPEIATVSPASALAALSAGARLIDLRGSMAYRAGHVAGAVWGIRPRLAAIVARDPGRPVLLIAETPAEAAFAAGDLTQAGAGPVRRVAGGHEALREAGAAIEADPGHPRDRDCIDHLFFVHDRHSGNMEAARRYLEWETGLHDQTSAAERAEFRLFHP